MAEQLQNQVDRLTFTIATLVLIFGGWILMIVILNYQEFLWLLWPSILLGTVNTIFWGGKAVMVLYNDKH